MGSRKPRWVSRVVADAIQTDMLILHGGMPSLRDENLLESTLTRPKQRFAYEPTADLAALTAACGYGLARNHSYNDGNKRVVFVVMAVFLTQWTRVHRRRGRRGHDHCGARIRRA